MKAIDNEERDLYLNSSTTKHITIKFQDGTKLDDKAIYFESMYIEQVLCEDEISFGSCNATEFDIKIYNIAESHVGQTMEVEMCVYEDDGDSKRYTRSLGTYVVISDELTDDKMFRQIKAYDLMYKLHNVDVSAWYNAIKFPVTLKTFRDSFFRYVNTEQMDIVLPNDNMVVAKTILSNLISGKDVIEAICQINACFGHISEDGRFQYIVIKHGKNALYPSDTLYPSDKLYPKDTVQHRMTRASFIQGSLKYEDYLSKKITQVQIRMEENDIGLTYGVDGNRYIIQDNFLVYGKTTEQLKVIAENFLSGIYFGDYTPAEVSCRCMPWAELGDFITVVGTRDTINFPILKRTISGIQALKDSYMAAGKEYFAEEVTGINSDIIKLKGKANVLERTIEETRSKISDINSSLQNDYYNISQTNSAIEQRAGEISLSVSNIQRQVNGQVNTYYGTEIPTLLNYPANEWNTEEKKALHNGDKFFVRDANNQIVGSYRFLADVDGNYDWTLIADTDVTQALNTATRALLVANDNTSKIDMQSKQIKSTVASASTKWISLKYDITYTSFGDPSNLPPFEGNPVGKYYLDQDTGKIYKCTDYRNNEAKWEYVENAILYNESVNSSITQAANEIKSVVAMSVVEWDTSAYNINYAGFGSPVSYYPPSSTYENKYYLDQQTGRIYKCIYSENVWKWNLEATAEAKTSKYESQLIQQANQISAKVSKVGGNSTSFGWTLNDTAFELKSSSKTVFKCDSKGVEISGKITAESGYIGDKTNGFTITSKAIYNGTSYFGSSQEGVYLGTDGISLSNYFSVDKKGSLKAKRGEIGGFTIGDNSLYRGSNTLGYKGGVYFGEHGISCSDNFKVDQFGKVIANEIHVASGTIGSVLGYGGFTIEKDKIYNRKSTLTGDYSGIYIGTDGIGIGGKYGIVLKEDGRASFNDKVTLDGDLNFGTRASRITYSGHDVIYFSSSNYINMEMDTNFNKNAAFEKGTEFKDKIELYDRYSKWGEMGHALTNFEPSTLKLGKSTGTVGFFGSSGKSQQSVSKLSSSATLANVVTKINDLITALVNYNLIK